jgi:hypothetical protein
LARLNLVNFIVVLTTQVALSCLLSLFACSNSFVARDREAHFGRSLHLSSLTVLKVKKGKAIHVTGREAP